MKLLSLLGITRLAPPGNNCLRNAHLCVMTLAQRYGLVCAPHQVAAAQQASPHHRNPDGKTDDPTVWKIPVDKKVFLSLQTVGCLATIVLNTKERLDRLVPVLCLL